jgi:DNA-binding NarL/FixJ family response regulator
MSPVVVTTRTTLAPDAAKKSGAGYTIGRSPGWHDQQMEHRVLIVDDNDAFRAAARQLLERAGFSVVAEAGSGAGGVEEAEAHNPDVAIVDVQLPDFDGFEVAARLSKLEPPPQVILTSSLDGADFGALVASSSALGFVPKAELSASLINALLSRTG